MMWSRGMLGALCLGLLLNVACKKSGDHSLPEPVAESTGPATSSGGGGPLPPNHPPISPPGLPSGEAANHPLPAGTRNPMEDIMAFKARLDKNPKDVEALLSLANANMMISRFDAAQDLYTRALAINPNDLDARTNLAIAYKYGGKPEQALIELQKNLGYDPRHDSTMYNLGFLYYYDKKDSAAALDVWKRWLALYPNAPAAGDVRKQIAQIETELGKGAVSSK
ncbi:MAG: tetratricopeptide repeat protein [Nitrospirae bacterium]|nr:tetratricopeptide repeat protein [Nitrospirota bacterium]